MPRVVLDPRQGTGQLSLHNGLFGCVHVATTFAEMKARTITGILPVDAACRGVDEIFGGGRGVGPRFWLDKLATDVGGSTLCEFNAGWVGGGSGGEGTTAVVVEEVGGLAVVEFRCGERCLNCVTEGSAKKRTDGYVFGQEWLQRHM